jgi:hypothetical protein
VSRAGEKETAEILRIGSAVVWDRGPADGQRGVLLRPSRGFMKGPQSAGRICISEMRMLAEFEADANLQKVQRMCFAQIASWSLYKCLSRHRS